MAKQSRRKNRSVAVDELLTVLIQNFDCQLSCSVNMAARSPQYAYRYCDEDPLYPAENQMTLTGQIKWPDDGPIGECEIVIYGDNAPSSHAQDRLKHAHELDEHGSRRWRTFHGREIPVCKSPAGLGTLDKARGQQAWSACIWSPTWLVSDMVNLLRCGRQLYATIQVRKEGRHRWIQSLQLQTKDPDQE
jgi:hypothetical protein